MLKSLALALAFTVAICSQAFAQEDELDARIRAYILNNPEVILEALEALSARQEASAMAERILEWWDDLSRPAGLGIGAPGAPIQVVEFFDYRCVPCKTIHPALVEQVAGSADLRVNMRHLPILSPGSERAARFALAVRHVAGDALYGAVHDAIWNLQGPLSLGQLEGIATAFELDFAQLENVMDSAAITERIDQNRNAAIALGIRGTPAFVTQTTVSFGSTDISALVAQWLSQ